ncbi:TrmB family transcriptional regulator [Halorussus salilacus]|uniref:TrmB family transcriptional regulator n=1 Tax=Halorussus salilacus TaxID=2953750 RepID=UPI0020A201EB|nr:helix-turn-helix domain-containing protein [Halorussus salilacus]USZ68385.1 TrmB family transcriptional regulator [Halorussus salilacus]
MAEIDTQAEAAGLLQQLGLKEYEAKCFVALTRMDTATAKDISEITDVPRTRVYDAIRVLEAQGLVEIQHTNPRQYRGVPLDEAARTLRRQYESRIDELQEALTAIEPAETNDEQVTHEVWSLSGTDGITSRSLQLLDEADTEVLFIISEDSLVTDETIETLQTVTARGVDVLVGTVTTEMRDRLRERVPDAEVFLSELEWLHAADDQIAIGRMLLVDESTILLSSLDESKGTEKAIFGRGFQNGLVVITRRLMATGLLPTRDPGK